MSTKTKEAVSGKAAGKGNKGTAKAGKETAQEAPVDQLQENTAEAPKVATAPAVACKHPEETAVNREREDGSGKWDRVCGVEGCGFVMCEVGKPKDVDQGASLEEAVTKAETDLGLTAPVLGETADNIVITPKDEIQGAPDGDKTNLFDQVQAGLAADGASLDETTGEISGNADEVCVNNNCPFFSVDAADNCNGPTVVIPSLLSCADFMSATGGVTSAADTVQEVKPDKVGKPFLKFLKVDVPEHRLAQLALRQAEVFSFWLKQQVAKKKAAKEFKEAIEGAEEELTTIAEIIEDGAEEQQISCRWEYDYRHGVKRLRRLDSNIIVDEETLTPEECHLSFDFEAGEGTVQEEPAGEEQEAPCAACPDHAEGCGHSPEDKQDCVDAMSETWVRNDERTLSVLGLAGVTVTLDLLAQQSPADLQAAEDWALAVHVQASDNDDFEVPTMPFFLKGMQGSAPVAAEFENSGAGLAEGPEVIGVDLAAGPDETVTATMEAGKVVDITRTLDVNRRCCLPTDRTTAVFDGVETIYCTVCGLVSRKRKEGADPWDDDLEFEIGEKVDLAGLA